ncbi:ribonucleoside-diphosphate reductase subunit alpha [Candidatus Dependentiae bacterium]|nr:ribonucleoside-diphosphate reductase subunit alpha [Candidatus Dependentiae bacterium]
MSNQLASTASQAPTSTVWGDLSIVQVSKRNGSLVPFEKEKIIKTIQRAAKGFEQSVSIELIFSELIKIIYDKISTRDLEKALVLATVSFIERDPAYSYVSARLFLQQIYKEAIGCSLTDERLAESYRKNFIEYISAGVEYEVLDKKLLEFDLEKLSHALEVENDFLFGYISIQTLYERYFRRHNGRVIELPQAFWMRVAMGLALNEKEFERTDRAIEFYRIFSSLRYVSSTPTLFHAGTPHPQLSSCYLTYVDDDLDHIFKCLKDNAHMSKWSGGLGNSWTQLRGTGSPISSIRVKSQGIIPFLKLANDVVAAINRSGSRRGATCAYLESWHYDFEDFLDLRRNTGDDRRRTHDMNTANWIPDLFMKRVIADESWTLFSPHETPDLHEIYGREFEQRYVEYEQKTHSGEIKFFKAVPARQLWRKMLSRLFETGHPWITFKDTCNIRSPQDHVGVVHSSNLCTEITLNTSKDETAVCNLGSINLARHVKDGKLDKDLLIDTINSAIRMLDNVIDINFYPTIEGKNSNLRHRPIGLGIMGFQDALFIIDIPMEDPRALELADTTMEFISYYAIAASSQLAKERGYYSSYKGSKWDRGIFPLDTLDLLEKERGIPVEVSRTSSMDWKPVREMVKKYGMRNSNLMAIAPTATISNIAGSFPSIEPIYKNIYVKANMSGEFTIINEYLVNDLKKLGLWNQDMLDQLKYCDGNIQLIQSIPVHIKEKYKEAFEIDPEWLIKMTAVRGKWIDQSQSHNVFMQGVSGQKLNDIYLLAWRSGLKATYYLRTLAASQIEKSTLDAQKFGFTQKREYSKVQESAIGQNDGQDETSFTGDLGQRSCGIEDESCESCQ